MSKYRIKTTEENNGHILYTPQYRVRKTWYGKDKWENIVANISNDVFYSIKTSINEEHMFKEVAKAITLIEAHKEHVIKEEGKKIKSIKYISYE